jgi:hypothetical protein
MVARGRGAGGKLVRQAAAAAAGGRQAGGGAAPQSLPSPPRGRCLQRLPSPHAHPWAPAAAETAGQRSACGGGRAGRRQQGRGSGPEPHRPLQRPGRPAAGAAERTASMPGTPHLPAGRQRRPPAAELLTHHVGCSTDQGKRPGGAWERHWRANSGDEPLLSTAGMRLPSSPGSLPLLTPPSRCLVSGASTVGLRRGSRWLLAFGALLACMARLASALLLALLLHTR